MTLNEKALYLGKEFVALYCIVLAAGYFAYFGGHMSSFEDLLVIGAYMILAIPFCLIAVTIGPNLFLFGFRRSVLLGIYGPWRPITATRHLLSRFGARPDPRAANRCEAEITYDAAGSPSARELVEGLAQQLRETGIGRSKTGGLIVYDNDTRWGVEPDPAEARLTVWIESADHRFQDQVFEGVRSYVDGRTGRAGQ